MLTALDLWPDPSDQTAAPQCWKVEAKPMTALEAMGRQLQNPTKIRQHH